MRVLITGMSGTGKSAVVQELRRRACTAYDADDDGFSEPAVGGGWRWRVDAISELMAASGQGLLFFAGCSDEQADLHWDVQVLLTAPEAVILARLQERTSNTYGKAAAERAKVLHDLREIEPLLRRSADVVIDTTQPLEVVVDHIVAAAAVDDRTSP